MNIAGQIGLFLTFLLFFSSGITTAVGELAVENRIERAELHLDLEKSLRMRNLGGIGMAVAIILAIFLMMANGMISLTVH